MTEVVKAIFDRDRKLERPRASRTTTKLVFTDQILATLEYWREYRTYFHISTNF
ncbi:MAG: transposase family protein [Prochloraceae cyanobacterium]|nr:transposase family protein [Prochloraceae cyanobacterium]